MNKMQKALSELAEMDELAAGSSMIHGLHPLAKLFATLEYMLVTLSFGKYDLDGLIPMALWPILLFQISGIEMKTCFYKLRLVLPLVMAVGLFNPFFDKTVILHIGSLAIIGGILSMLTLMLKGIFCLMASFLMMATTPADHLCAALLKLHFPKLLVTLFLLTYRYVGVMTEELAVMTDAYHLRAPGQKGIHVSAWGSFLGQLLLRSMDRAQELYSSMILRGYQQDFHYVDVKAFCRWDALYVCVNTAVFQMLRAVKVTELFGGLIMR